jgi:sulfate transport system permease protein
MSPVLTQTRRLGGQVMTRGLVMGYVSLIVLLPLAAIVATSLQSGLNAFWLAATTPAAVAALALSLGSALLVVLVNAVLGTLIAWVLVRDDFPGKGIMNALIDLPFALPTIVAGVTLLALYGPNGPTHVNLAYTRVGIVVALLFVTLPFVVRAVQPVLYALDQEVEEAAAMLGAGPALRFRRIVLPALLPAMLSGGALAFARAVGEFGSVVLISGNIPFNTELAAVHIFGDLESDDTAGAASVAVVLLALSLLVMLLISAVERWGARHEG